MQDFITFLLFLYIHSFIHSFCVLSYNRSIASSKCVLHRVWASASSFNLQYFIFYLRSSSSCLRLFPHLPITFILPSIFPSITCFRRPFLHKMWSIQLAFPLFIIYRLFLSSLFLCNTLSLHTRSVQLIFSLLFQHHSSKCLSYFWSAFQSVYLTTLYPKCSTSLVSSLQLESKWLVKRVFFMLKAAFAMTVLDLIYYVHLASFVMMLPK